MISNPKTESIKGRTAIIVIHGIGEQNLYETLEGFTDGLINYFESQKVLFKVEHQLARRRESTGADWTESFVQLSPSEDNKDWLIDIHEYYWAYQTEEKINVSEVLAWADQTLKGTIQFYEEKGNHHLLSELLDSDEEDKQHNKEKKNRNRFFKFRLRSLALYLRIFNFIYPVIRLLTWGVLLLAGPFLRGRFLQSAGKLSKKIVLPLMVDYVGDITLYTTTDAKSPYCRIRQQILAESLAFLEAILKEAKAGQYDQVLLAGHSLGSVIAYDTLNLLCVKASISESNGRSLDDLTNKLTGLITFGSPLDKIAFFFREEAQKQLMKSKQKAKSTQPKQYLRQRILGHLNSFRVNPTFLQKSEKYFTKSPVTYHMDGIRWFNYYHWKDPISGKLDYYHRLNNKRLKFEAKWGAEAHGGYWSDCDDFFNSIAENFLYKTQADSLTRSDSNTQPTSTDLS